MLVWVLVFWLADGRGGATTVPNIATEGDCLYLAGKMAEQFEPQGWAVHRACFRYKTAK